MAWPSARTGARNSTEAPDPKLCYCGTSPVRTEIAPGFLCSKTQSFRYDTYVTLHSFVLHDRHAVCREVGRSFFLAAFRLFLLGIKTSGGLPVQFSLAETLQFGLAVSGPTWKPNNAAQSPCLETLLIPADTPA